MLTVKKKKKDKALSVCCREIKVSEKHDLNFGKFLLMLFL